MIKVIHVISDTNIGGAGRWILNLLKYIDREKFLVKVIIPRGSLLKQEIQSLDTEVIEVPGMADRSFDLKAIGSLYKIFLREKAQIVHTHASLSARIAAKMAGVKRIVHTKHCIDLDIKKGIGTKIGAAVNALLSDKMIAVGLAAKENLIQSGIPENKILVVHNGVEPLEEIPPEQKEKLKSKWMIKDGDTVIGIVARLEEIKGHTYFIEAAARVAGIRENVKFIIAGTGSLEKQLKEKVKDLGLEQKVIFTGHVQKVAEVMNIIDIVVISSLSEALCLSLVEAMSLAKPCIATDTGGNPEVVEDGCNGLLVPVKNPEQLAEAMIRLVDDPDLRRKMGEKGKKKMYSNFTSEIMTRKIEKIYGELI
ncbi:MAG: glycosyltransferase [Clostridiaceae bacterium]|nr:glycosyltransferase [Clostridiaceae bacterium]